jgi:hypothetical protein
MEELFDNFARIAGSVVEGAAVLTVLYGSAEARAIQDLAGDWRRAESLQEVLQQQEVSGAGYGDRTRLTGLGSQDITTMLSPPSTILHQAYFAG